MCAACLPLLTSPAFARAVDCFKRNLLPPFLNEQLTRFHRVAGQVRARPGKCMHCKLPAPRAPQTDAVNQQAITYSRPGTQYSTTTQAVRAQNNASDSHILQQLLYRVSDLVVPCNATFNTSWELWLGTDPNRLMPLLNALEIEHYPLLQVRSIMPLRAHTHTHTHTATALRTHFGRLCLRAAGFQPSKLA